MKKIQTYNSLLNKISKVKLSALSETNKYTLFKYPIMQSKNYELETFHPVFQ